MSAKLKKNLYYLSWILILILSIVLFRLLKVYDIFCTFLSISSPIIFGFIFAWILYPIYKKLSKNMSKLISVGIIILAFLVFYAVLVWKLIPIIIENVTHLLSLFSEYIEKFSKYPIFENLKDYRSIDMDMIISSCGNIASSIALVVLIHIFGFYMLYNYETIIDYLKGLIPEKYKRTALYYIRKISKNMRAYIRGTLLDTLILFVISSVLYLIIGLEYPILLAFFSAITNIIPFIGPYIGGIPAVLVGLKNSVRLAIMTVATIVLAQTVESNVVNPMIMSKCIKVNPLLIIITLTIMGRFFGLIGMIFAVPLLIILKLTLEFLEKYRILKNKAKKAEGL